MNENLLRPEEIDCPVCGMKFKDKKPCERVAKLNKNPSFPKQNCSPGCSICDAVSALARHVKTIHLEELSFYCPVCPSSETGEMHLWSQYGDHLLKFYLKGELLDHIVAGMAKKAFGDER